MLAILISFKRIILKKRLFTLVFLIPLGCQSKVTFTESYKNQNRGEFQIEIPEIQELVHIAIALTPTGIRDANMVNHTTEYYMLVMNHFESLKNEPLIHKLDEIIATRYSHIKMDACGYYFNNQNKIVKNNKALV